MRAIVAIRIGDNKLYFGIGRFQMNSGLLIR